MNGRAVFHRTELGEHELSTRVSELNPRAYQLLPMLDGSRDLHSLCHMFAPHELEAYVVLLETTGMIRQGNSPANRAGANPKIPAGSSLTERRENVLRQLLETLGTKAEPFALRTTKCQTDGELRELVKAMQLVVEVQIGPDQAARFAKQALQV